MSETNDSGREAVRDAAVDYLLTRLSESGVTDADERYDAAEPIAEDVLKLIDARIAEVLAQRAAR